MEKTVKKPRQARETSTNTVNSWSNGQSQRNPKEVQPVIIPPRSPMKAKEDWPMPRREQGQIAYRQDRTPVPEQLAPPKRVSRDTASRKVRWATFPWLSKKVVVSFFITLLAFAGGVVYLNMTVPAVGILVNDKHFGFSASMGEAEGIVYEATHVQGEETVEDANTQTDDKIRYMPQRVDKKTYEENQASTDDIAQYVTTYIPGFGISVDDHIEIVLESKDEAQNVLNDLQAYYADASETNTVASVTVVETVKVEDTKALPLHIKSKEQALQALIDGKTQSVNYTVQIPEGETLWDIAQKHSTTIEAILAENKDKGFTAESTLTEGSQVKVVTVQPYLNVVVEGMRVASEEIAFDTETKQTASLAINTSKIEQDGQAGSKDVTYTYKSTNGVIAEGDKIIINEVVTREPVVKIVLEGTNATRLASSGGGGTSMLSRGEGIVPSLTWPVPGIHNVSSYWRTSSRPNHAGIDIASRGNPSIVAAADGVVVSVQYSYAGYGHMILIDHGGGVGTRYAHLLPNSITVSSGEYVAKGQEIAKMGNTGNSTGDHLHYEVLVNGRDTNPMSYY